MVWRASIDREESDAVLPQQHPPAGLFRAALAPQPTLALLDALDLRTRRVDDLTNPILLFRRCARLGALIAQSPRRTPAWRISSLGTWAVLRVDCLDRRILLSPSVPAVKRAVRNGIAPTGGTSSGAGSSSPALPGARVAVHRDRRRKPRVLRERYSRTP